MIARVPLLEGDGVYWGVFTPLTEREKKEKKMQKPRPTPERRKLINNLLQTHEAYVFRGAGHPEDSEATTLLFLMALNTLERHLNLRESVRGDFQSWAIKRR
jgi:hypothetical protein